MFVVFTTTLIAGLIDGINPFTWHYLAIAASILIVAYLSYSFFKKDQPTAIQGEVQKKSVTQTEETHLSAGALITLGIASCLAEISSIAPYLALLSYYATISITNLQATLLLAFYSFVLFVLPMYGLFLMSLFFKSHLTTIYTRIAGWMDFFITRILPVILFLIAVALFGYGIQIF